MLHFAQRSSLLSLVGLNLFSQGIWAEIQEQATSSGSPHLIHLAGVLKRTTLAAKASGTVVNYSNSLKHWIEFSKDRNLVPFPATVVDIALFFSHLTSIGVSASVIETIYSALKWVHDIGGVTNPMTNPFVKTVVEGAKRANAKPVVKKTPISKDVLKACCEKYATCNELPIRRNISVALLLFAGFFRFSELADLTLKDITISDSHLTIQVTRSKTDQYRKGDEVVIIRSDKVTCPVVNLERYMLLANIDTSKASSDYLFKPLVKVRSGFKLIEKVKPLSYTRARESVVGLLKEFVPDTANISLHSFRAGGATAAANAQVPDRCWKRHGRWRSDSAKDGYVEDSIDNRLLVSQSLGI